MNDFVCPPDYICSWSLSMRPKEFESSMLAGANNWLVFGVAAAIVFIVLILAAAWNTKR